MPKKFPDEFKRNVVNIDLRLLPRLASLSLLPSHPTTTFLSTTHDESGGIRWLQFKRSSAR